MEEHPGISVAAFYEPKAFLQRCNNTLIQTKDFLRLAEQILALRQQYQDNIYNCTNKILLFKSIIDFNQSIVKLHVAKHYKS